MADKNSGDEHEGPQPTTNLSTAFIIVFVLHAVAVAGIYVYNSMKSAHKKPPEQPAAEKVETGAQADNSGPEIHYIDLDIGRDPEKPAARVEPKTAEPVVQFNTRAK